MTRFSRIFSTILSLRAITGREENFDDENGFEYDELHDEVGDEAIATHFLSLSLLEFFLVYSLVSLFVLQNLIEKQWDMKNNNKNSCFCIFFHFRFFYSLSLSLSLSLSPALVSLFDGQ